LSRAANPVISKLLKKLVNEDDFNCINDELRNRCAKNITEACFKDEEFVKNLK